MIHYAHRMDQKGWVANHDGNLTVRMDLDRFLATPTSRSKADLGEDDLIEVDLKGKKLAGGKGEIFSEFLFHSRVYELRDDVQAVVHAHPPIATAVGCANQEIVTSAIPEAVVSLGPGIPLVGLGAPGGGDLMAEWESTIPYYDAMMVGGNGVFTFGKDLEQAFLRLELVEHVASILWHSLPLGGPRLLDARDLNVLLEKRKKAGLSRAIDPARPQWFFNGKRP